MWYIFALLSALTATVRRGSEKQLSHQLHYFTVGWVTQLYSLPIVIVAQMLVGEFFNPLTLGMRFWLPTLISSVVLFPLFIYCYINAIKHGELSSVLPLQSLTPVFSLITGMIFIDQVPTATAVLGIFIVTIGIYILNLKGKYLHNPLKVFRGDRPNTLMLASIVITAIAGACDKAAMQVSDPVYYTLMGTCINFLVLWVITGFLKLNQYSTIKRHTRTLFLSGTLKGTSYLLYVFALDSGPLAYVSTIKSASILMGSLVGFVYFKERATKVKVIALALITVGSVILGLAA